VLLPVQHGAAAVAAAEVAVAVVETWLDCPPAQHELQLVLPQDEHPYAAAAAAVAAVAAAVEAEVQIVGVAVVVAEHLAPSQLVQQVHPVGVVERAAAAADEHAAVAAVLPAVVCLPADWHSHPAVVA
jgi:hypothetical protein